MEEKIYVVDSEGFLITILHEGEEVNPEDYKPDED